MTRIALAMSLLLSAAPVAAQDVIVMRRPVTVSNLGTPLSTAPSDLKGSWTTGDWQFTGPAACTPSAPQQRTVTCTAGGRTVEDARCQETKPATNQTVARYDGCTTAWVAGEWSEYSSTCSPTATRSRTVTCTRSGGTIVPEARPETECSGTKPDSQEGPTNVTSGCPFFRWNYTDGACTAYQQRARTIVCQRVEGSTVTDVAESNCDAATRPAAYTTDTGCAPKSTSCTVQQDSIINNFTSDGSGSVDTNVGIYGKTADQIRDETVRFCQTYVLARSCQGYVSKYNPNTLVLHADVRTANVLTTTQIYGSSGKTSFPHAYSGSCTPAF